MKKILSLALVLVLALSLFACQKDTPDFWDEAVYLTDTTLGEGAKTLSVDVEAGGKTVHFTVKTDRDTVGEALLDCGLIAGDAGPYGLYVKTVNGILADYDADQTYWAFYIGEEMAMTGVDQTAIEEGVLYRLVKTK